MKKFILFICYMLIVSNLYAADTKTSDLGETTDIQGTDELYLNDAGTSKKITATNVFDIIDTEAELETISGITNILRETEIDASSELLAIMDDETGTGLLTFATAPTFTTSITVGAAAILEAELEFIDGITAGTAAASKALILDASLDIATINVLTATSLVGPLTGEASTAAALAADPADCAAGSYTLGINAAGTAQSCTDATTEINSVVNGIGGTNLTCASENCNVDDAFLVNDANDTMTGVLTADGLTLGANENITLGAQTLDHDGTDFVFNDSVKASTAYIIGSASMSETDLEKLDGITNGTAAASKALILDASLDIATINSLTATTLVGALTGNASTATALAGDPADCAANEFADAINAAGVLSCNGVVDADVSDTLTASIIDLEAGTITNIATTEIMVGVGAADASYVSIGGEATMDNTGAITLADSVTVTGWVMGASTATTPAADDSDTSLATTAYVQGELQLDGLSDVGTSTATAGNLLVGNGATWQSQTMGGRSITIDADSIDADIETYIYKAKVAFENPVATDDFVFGELTHAVTFTSIYCKTLVGTVTLDVTSGGTDIEGTDIVCDTDGQSDAGISNASGSASDEIKLAITSIASAPTYLFLQLNGTMDD